MRTDFPVEGSLRAAARGVGAQLEGSAWPRGPESRVAGRTRVAVVGGAVAETACAEAIQVLDTLGDRAAPLRAFARFVVTRKR